MRKLIGLIELITFYSTREEDATHKRGEGLSQIFLNKSQQI